METSLEAYADKLMAGDTSVRGVLIIDGSGLALCNRGSLQPEMSAHLSEMVKLAGRLEPGAVQSPVVSLETNGSSRLVLSREGEITVVVHRS